MESLSDSVWANKMSYWIDSHSHMNSLEFRDNQDYYFSFAKENNVLRNNVICLNKEEFIYTLEMKKKYPIDISFGYYPEDCEKINEEDLLYLENNLNKIIAIGEIGLDYHGENVNKEKQKALFIKQIEMANKFQKPIIIHTRDASKDTFDILKQYAKTKVLLHCFSESGELLKEYLKLGYYVSFSGVVTFKNAKSVQENAFNCPIENIMIETDCPYLTPVPFRGKMNQTAYVRYVGEYIAKLKNIDEEILQAQLIKNYEEFIDEKD